MKTICFDVDGTLIDFNDKPRWDVVNMLKTLAVKHTIVVWSGGGADYAEMWVRRLFLEDYVDEMLCKPKNSEIEYDLCFDDEEVMLAKINVQI